MKCFKKLQRDVLGDDFFKRIGAWGTVAALPEHVYVAKNTLTSLRGSYAGKAPSVVAGLPENIIIVDSKSVLAARLEEFMVTELARDQGHS